MEPLSRGITYDIYFKTDDSQIQADVLPRLEQLGELLKPYKQINIHIAGYADARGSEKYNLQLSRQRIEQVRQQFLVAGIAKQRLQTHAYGERSASLKQDSESYMFDRRVTITLTLDQEV